MSSFQFNNAPMNNQNRAPQPGRRVRGPGRQFPRPRIRVRDAGLIPPQAPWRRLQRIRMLHQRMKPVTDAFARMCRRRLEADKEGKTPGTWNAYGDLKRINAKIAGGQYVPEVYSTAIKTGKWCKRFGLAWEHGWKGVMDNEIHPMLSAVYMMAGRSMLNDPEMEDVALRALNDLNLSPMKTLPVANF